MNCTTDNVVLICSNYAWTIYNFRLPLIRALKNSGYRVEIVTQFDGYEKEFSKEVDRVHGLFISRKGANPFIDLITFFHIFSLLVKTRPVLFLSFSIKPVIYGSIASKLLRVPTIAMITGLGTAFITDNWITKIAKELYRIALSSVSTVFFQNLDDKNLFLSNRLVHPKACRMSPGSGVDLVRFRQTKLPNKGKITFLLIARLLRDKGVKEFVEAATAVSSEIPNTEFQLLGPLGVESRTAISSAQIAEWEKNSAVVYLGQTDDVVDYIDRATCIVLPSYREGTSRVLLEAAAMGRPIITTDVPGCREVVEQGENGFLCKPKDSIDLKNKMIKMASISHGKRQEMGEKGRKKIEKEFDQDIVSRLYLDAINDVIPKIL